MDRYTTFISCLFPENKRFRHTDVIYFFEKNYGSILSYLPNTDWTPPSEYTSEMGPNLLSEIWIFKSPMSIDAIVSLKKMAMWLEDECRDQSLNRAFNLNPGYFDHTGMFLLTHKPNRHRGRKKLAANVWKEKQYNSTNGVLRPNQNTFSEFLDRGRLHCFNMLNNNQILLPTMCISNSGLSPILKLNSRNQRLVLSDSLVG